jgi:hypothetical protein
MGSDEPANTHKKENIEGAFERQRKMGKFIVFLGCAGGIHHNSASQLHPVCSSYKYVSILIAKVKVVKL